MDTAICVEDGHTYTAVEFSGLQPLELARKRRQLICEECEGPAFFRKRTRSGRGACFGARPHVNGCTQAAADHDQVIPGIADDENEIYNPGDRIVLDLNYGGAEQEVHLDQRPGQTRRPRGGRHIGDGRQGYAEMHRRLSTMLRTLVTAPNFRYSDQIIEVAGHPEMPARDFFVNFADVTPQYNHQFRGYWGLLSDARYGGDGSLWLNSGGRGEISFCLATEHIAPVLERYRFQDEDDFSGAYLLVLGTVGISHANKIFCIVENPALLSLR